MNLFNYKIILDPVMVATSGDILVSDEVIASIKNDLISKSFLITPNIYEAEILSEMKVNNIDLQYCKKKKILFLSTPKSIDDARFLNKIGMRVFKIGSGDILDFELLNYIAKTKKKVILSQFYHILLL